MIYSFKISISELLLIFFLFFFFSGCALLQVKEDTKIINESTILVGNISSNIKNWDMPVVVAAYAINRNKKEIIHYVMLHELGSYELIVPESQCNIVAFGDKNNNLIYDEGEPIGRYLEDGFITVKAGGVITDLDFVILEPEKGIQNFLKYFEIPSNKIMPFHKTSPGVVADLDNILFSEKYGKKGYWSSIEFFINAGGNIYFLEEYDPKKIPILFVHGASGSPQDWRTIFNSIDRTKFQPWFYYYPSGSSLNAMTYLLFWKLINIQKKYNCPELYITAHSMGGLIVRNLFMDFGQSLKYISNFISISTPWGGDENVESGIKYSPGVIPSWNDMLPQGNFLKSIYRTQLPSSVTHFLFFGHKGNRNLLRPNNDNVVTLASQLDKRAQDEAEMIYGFDEDHISILSSEYVINQFNSLLDEAYGKSRNKVTESGKRIRINTSFDIPANQPKPLTYAILQPTQREMAETRILINSEKPGQVYGPFPTGEYEVSLAATAFIPEPRTQKVKIEENLIPQISFKMKPQGFLYGYFAINKNSIYGAGQYKKLAKNLNIISLTLKGDGILRVLIPNEKENITFTDYYLSQTDYLDNGAFYFFDLPDGEYEITAEIEGDIKYSKSRKVFSGVYESPIIFETAIQNDFLEKKMY